MYTTYFPAAVVWIRGVTEWEHGLFHLLAPFTLL